MSEFVHIWDFAIPIQVAIRELKYRESFANQLQVDGILTSEQVAEYKSSGMDFLIQHLNMHNGQLTFYRGLVNACNINGKGGVLKALNPNSLHPIPDYETRYSPDASSFDYKTSAAVQVSVLFHPECGTPALRIQTKHPLSEGERTLSAAQFMVFTAYREEIMESTEDGKEK